MQSAFFKFLKIFLLTLFISSFALTNTSSALAQTPPASGYTCGTDPSDPQCDLQSDYEKALKDNNLMNTGAWLFVTTTETLNRGLVGAPPQATSSASPQLPYKQDNGLIGLVASNILTLKNERKVSSVDYLASINPIKPAQAAGFQTLFPVFKIWELFRNVAYVLIVVVMIIFGFMIMFRYNLDPRTVVTISDALPRLITALVLITFSYAISGLFLDAEKVVEQFVGSTLAQLAVGPTSDLVNADMSKGGPVPENDRFRSTVTSGGRTVEQIKFPASFKVNDILEFEGFFTGIGNVFGSNFQIGGHGAGFNLSAISDSIARMVINFTLFSILIQLLFSLIRYFASFFILTIFGPVIILWSVLPGQEDTIKHWFLQLATATVVFPAVFLLLNIAFYINVWAKSSGIGSNYFNTPEFRSTVPSLVDVSNAQNIASFLVLGILLITTKTPELIEEAFRIAPKGSASRAGVDVKGAVKKLPIIGGLA